MEGKLGYCPPEWIQFANSTPNSLHKKKSHHFFGRFTHFPKIWDIAWHILAIPFLENQLFMGLALLYKYPFEEGKQVIVYGSIINFNNSVFWKKRAIQSYNSRALTVQMVVHLTPIIQEQSFTDSCLHT